MFLLPKVWEGIDYMTSRWPAGLPVWVLMLLKALVHPGAPSVMLSVEEVMVQGQGFQIALRVSQKC